VSVQWIIRAIFAAIAGFEAKACRQRKRKINYNNLGKTAPEKKSEKDWLPKTDHDAR